MTYQSIRLRTDIFQSQEFALMEERTDNCDPLILPEPVPSIRNEMFNQINEPEVICLGNGRDLICDYNDNHSSKETPYHRINDIQGQIIEDEQSLEVVKEELKSKDKELDGQINESKKAKKRQIPSFSCYVCQIGQKKGNLHLHLSLKRVQLGDKKKRQRN